MNGFCPNCKTDTSWKMHNGWYFHTSGNHWRCEECGCVTERAKMTPGAQAEYDAALKHRKFRIKLKRAA